MANTITLELTPEDRARLDTLTRGLDRVAHLLEKLVECDRCATVLAQTTPVVEADPTPTIEQAKPEKPTEAENEPESEAPTESEAVEVDEPKTVELSDLQQKVIALVRAGKKDKVQSIVNEYAERVSAIPEDKRAEVWDKLTALEEVEA